MQNDLSPKKETVVFGLDSVVIRKCLADIQGGRTLDCSGISLEVLAAGHVIVKLASGEYAPMPVTAGTEDSYALTSDTSVNASKTYYTLSAGVYSAVASPEAASLGSYYEKTEGTPAAYAALPAGASYAGILKDSVLVSSPAAAIMTAGVVNPELVPYPMTSILEAFKTALPTIIFEKDEEA